MVVSANLASIVARSGVMTPNPKTITKMFHFLPTHVNNILLSDNTELAREIYFKAQQLPSTTTIARMKTDGISIIESCAHNENAIILYGHKGDVPVALKFIRNDAERERLTEYLAVGIVHSSIITFEFITYERTRFLICMPRLVSTLLD